MLNCKSMLTKKWHDTIVSLHHPIPSLTRKDVSNLPKLLLMLSTGLRDCVWWLRTARFSRAGAVIVVKICGYGLWTDEVNEWLYCTGVMSSANARISGFVCVRQTEFWELVAAGYGYMEWGQLIQSECYWDWRALCLATDGFEILLLSSHWGRWARYSRWNAFIFVIHMCFETKPCLF